MSSRPKRQFKVVADATPQSPLNTALLNAQNLAANRPVGTNESKTLEETLTAICESINELEILKDDAVQVGNEFSQKFKELSQLLDNTKSMCQTQRSDQ